MRTTWKDVLAISLLSGTLTTVFLAGLAVVIFFNWGTGQCFTPELAQRKLTAGMTPAAAEFALALSPGSLSGHLDRIKDGESAAYLARSGNGCMFVPQFEITLVFDKDEKLDRFFAEIHWRCDEVYVPVTLRNAEDAIEPFGQ